MFLAGTYMNCGGMRFPYDFASVTRIIYVLIQYAVPLGIIVLGSLDFLKATIAGDESEMKKKQSKFVSRLISGAIVFFILTITQVLINFMAVDTKEKSLVKCVQCLTVSEKGCEKIISIDEDPEINQGEPYGE